MQIFTHSEPGGKVINEDFVIARRHPSGGDRFICLLADGQGGQSNGGAAARAACETAWNLTSQRLFDELLNPTNWSELLRDVDEAVADTGGFTTLVALAIDQECVVGASCGDSKAFLASSGGGKNMTEITQRQYRNPPVGSSEAEFVPFLSHEIEESRVLIVSDGVWKYCGQEALISAFDLADFSDAAKLLRTSTLSRCGTSLPDDFSVIGISIE